MTHHLGTIPTSKLLAAFLFLILLPALPAQADFHDWRIVSIYSNPDGSLQYIQLLSSTEGQGVLGGHRIVATPQNGSESKIFEFPNNITGSTLNRFLLLATDNLASLPGGIEADFVIPAGFLPLTGGSLVFEGADSFQYTAGQLPKNGSQALSRTQGAVTAAVQNFIGQFSTITDQAHGFYDASTMTVHLPVVNIPGTGVFGATLEVTSLTPITLRLLSHYEYASGISLHQNAALFSGGVLQVPAVRIGNEVMARQLDLIDASNFTFSNLRLLEPGPGLAPDPEPAPQEPSEPNAEQIALEQSIARGSSLYQQRCAVCHCTQGQGFCSSGAPSLRNSTLASSDMSIFIDTSMPLGNASACTDQCAEDTANFILHSFAGEFTGSPGEDYQGIPGYTQ